MCNEPGKGGGAWTGRGRREFSFPTALPQPHAGREEEEGGGMPGTQALERREFPISLRPFALVIIGLCWQVGQDYPMGGILPLPVFRTGQAVVGEAGQSITLLLPSPVLL